MEKASFEYTGIFFGTSESILLSTSEYQCTKRRFPNRRTVYAVACLVCLGICLTVYAVACLACLWRSEGGKTEKWAREWALLLSYFCPIFRLTRLTYSMRNYEWLWEARATLKCLNWLKSCRLWGFWDVDFHADNFLRLSPAAQHFFKNLQLLWTWKR